MDIEKIKELALANGFKLKEQASGNMDLNAYVYDFANAIEQAVKAQAVPAKLVLELEKGRFKEYEYKALLRQSLRASKVTRSKLNWVHVMSMLGTGSTVAHRICEALGVNPDGTEFKTQEPAND